MKKLLVFSLSLMSILALGNTLISTTDNSLTETTLLDGQETISLKTIRKENENNTEELLYSKMFTQYGYDDDNNYYLRFSTAIKGNIETISYTRIVEGKDDLVKSVDTIYYGILANDKIYYYDGTNSTYSTDASLKGDYYWTCYTIKFSSNSEFKDKDITLSLKVNEKVIADKTTSLNKELGQDESISFEKSSYTILKGSSSEKLVVNFSPEDSSEGKTIKYSSSNQNIATISDDGTVTGLDYGRTVITAEVDDKKTTCEVIVTRFADSTGLTMHYNEQDGTLQNVTINADNIAQRVNTFATGDGQGSYVYYAEATFNGISLKDFTGGTTGIGMVHAASVNNSKTSNKDFLFDKINSYIFDINNNNYGMWYRQGMGYDVSDNDLLYNVNIDMLGTFGTTMIKTFTEQTSLKYGIARDNNYIYTFINDVMMLKRVIPSELKNKATYAGIYTDCCAEEGHYIDNITYLDGEEALQKINSADRSFVLSRNEGNEVKFGENNKSFTLTGKGNWWATSVTPTEFFDANVTIDFDLTHHIDTDGHIIFNIVGNEEQFKGNTDKTDIKAANNTVVAYSMWTNATGTQVNGVDVYPDTTTGYNDKANRDYVEFAKNDGVLHYTIKLSMDENGLVTSVITVKAGETIIATATKTTTKAWNNKDLSIHFLAGEKVGYTVSNFTVTKDSTK